MVEDRIEEMARALCVLRGVDPDGTGYAVTQKTRETLGETYPLWRYRVAEVEVILGMLP